MEYKFTYKFVKIAPRKVRLVAELVKNMRPDEAITQLKFLPKNAAICVLELIKSGMTALSEKKTIIKDVKIKSLFVDQGPMLKRRRFRSRGRADMIQKKMSHITLILADETKKRKNIETKKRENKKVIKSKK